MLAIVELLTVWVGEGMQAMGRSCSRCEVGIV